MQRRITPRVVLRNKHLNTEMDFTVTTRTLHIHARRKENHKSARNREEKQVNEQMIENKSDQNRRRVSKEHFNVSVYCPAVQKTIMKANTSRTSIG